MLARCRVHEVSQEWGCEWGSSYMNESIHSVSSHDCRFLRSRMRCASLVITRRAAVDMSTATTTAACTRARAARAHHTLKLGPRIYGPRRCLYLCPGGLCFPDPTSAGGSFPPSRAGGFLRRERPVVEERRRARAACDLEGNRAGLGCLEHLGNALSFAVVTEWPVRVYPRRRRWSPPHACLE